MSCPLRGPDLFQISQTGPRPSPLPIPLWLLATHSQGPGGKPSCPFFWGQRNAGAAGAGGLTSSAILGWRQAWDTDFWGWFIRRCLRAPSASPGEEAAEALVSSLGAQPCAVIQQGKGCLCAHVVKGWVASSVASTARPTVSLGERGGPRAGSSLQDRGSYNRLPAGLSPWQFSLRQMLDDSSL